MGLNSKSYDVSVIVPVYNAEKYVKQCLDSLVAQTLKNLEIIVINDGSTDNSLKILNYYASTYDNVKLINQKNHGLYYTRKIGLNNAIGEYIGWVDADDFVDKNMFSILYKLAKSENSDMAYCEYNFFPKKSNTKEYWFRKFNGRKDVDFVERNSQPWNKIVKKSLLVKLNIGEMFESCFDEAYIKVLINCKNPIYSNKKLYYYRITENSMSSTYDDVNHYYSFINASINLKREMNELCKKSKYWNDYFEYRIIYYSILSMIVAANAGEKSAFYKIKNALYEKHNKYRHNRHIKHILTTNFSKLKCYVMIYIIPINYSVTRAICKCVF